MDQSTNQTTRSDPIVCDDDHSQDEVPAFRPRPYQVEMVEESMKRNIIVAMDTGSGKTHIALTRARIELESCDPLKLVWFLAPTVTLCSQQYQVAKINLPAYQVRILSGEDNTERWSDQQVWDEVLKNISIVFSTHAILLDALTHGFVTMSRLALLIFDEAHHCTGNHPANQIMMNFYRASLARSSKDIPRVLGLSASPVINAQASGLHVIEQNLNAIVRTPKEHRAELAKYVYLPALSKLVYQRKTHDDLEKTSTPALRALRSAYFGLNILEDPYVVELQQRLSSDPVARKRFNDVLLNHKTHCHEQLRRLTAKASTVHEEVGAWAADWFIKTCITKCSLIAQRYAGYAQELTGKEITYLDTVLEGVKTHLVTEEVSAASISSKAKLLLDLLQGQFSPDSKGLVFVEQRATVAALAQLLASAVNPELQIMVGTFVGTSTSSMRDTKITDLVELRNQQETLDNFKVGAINLIITTNVLEEGIDISSCNVVICFDPPKNLKSFIQRRGRARKQESKYIIMLADDDPASADPARWQDLEEVMKAAYLDDLRQIQPAQEEKETIEHQRHLRVASTGALLTTDNAMAHLSHFCATLQDPYVDCRPQIIYSRDQEDMVSAKIVLPNAVDPAVRQATSSRPWPTERMARKDAAFEAYSALFKAGLVNNNMLPLTRDMEDVPEMNENQQGPSLVPISRSFDPWLSVAHAHTPLPTAWSRTEITVQAPLSTAIKMVMLLPVSIFPLPVFNLYWNNDTIFQVKVATLEPVHLSAEDVTAAQIVTHLLLSSVYGTRMQDKRLNFLTLFVPIDLPENIEDWQKTMIGATPALTVNSQGLTDTSMPSSLGLVREVGKPDSRYLFKGFFIEEDTSGCSERLLISATKFPKRRNFLQPLSCDLRNAADADVNAYTTVLTLPAEEHTIDKLPADFSLFALFVPSILRRCEVLMAANELSKGILRPVAITDLELLSCAITASSTNEASDYQRLEFLGDCVLKLYTSVQLMAQHLRWPEQYLTAGKGRTNSNTYLAKASLQAGLDHFILMKPFAGTKWRPTFVDEVLERENRVDEKVLCSSKVLADVVEALIGASFIDGGLPKARICLRTLLPQEQWFPLSQSHSILFDGTPTLPVQLHRLEDLVGYQFRKGTFLLEAITHASFNDHHQTSVVSYQRLEFLGDAVLDFIVVRALFSFKPELRHYVMHSIRAALVNASFLALLCMELSINEERAEIRGNLGGSREGSAKTKGTSFETTMTYVPRSLWQFMRHSSPDITDAQQAALKRYHLLRHEISASLVSGPQYPWSSLTALHADKFFSDIVESVIGAIYVDSLGDMRACEAFIERLGLFTHMRRILQDHVDCLHPKEKLGQMANQAKVKYDLKKDGPLWHCQVSIGEQPIGASVEGQSRADAETRAASEALAILMQGSG